MSSADTNEPTADPADSPGTDVAVTDAASTEVEVVDAGPVDDLREGLVARLRELLGDGVVEHHIIAGKDAWVRVTNEAWQQAAHSIRFTMGARHFGFVSAIDWLPSPFGRSMDSEVDNIVKGRDAKALPEMQTGYAGGETRFQVFARVTNLNERWGLTLKADAGDENPAIGTWTKVYAGADWHEREAWEMYGIDFVGHPALRHIYLPGEFEGNPLRKDFPLLARMVKPWPGLVDVEPMPGSGDTDEPDAEVDAAGGDN